MKARGLKAALLCAVGLLVLAPAQGSGQQESTLGPPSRVDPIPKEYRESLARFERRMEALALIDRLQERFRIGEVRPFSVQVPESFRWPRSGVVTVAFLGGSEGLRARIESVAKEWLAAEGVALELSFHDERGDYREWKRSDASYQANIRIAFDLDGYWSLVGNASMVDAVAGPHQASMSLAGFAEELPWQWDAVILHEFGHALGFEHEHQHPIERCFEQMKWDSDPGYVETPHPEDDSFIVDSQGRSPGLNKHFGGPPNNWSETEIRDNIRAIDAELVVGEFDPDSIMKYYFPGWLFLSGEASSCFSQETTVLSEKDLFAMRCSHAPDPPESCPPEPDNHTQAAAISGDEFRGFLKALEETAPQGLFETLEAFEGAMQEIVRRGLNPP